MRPIVACLVGLALLSAATPLAVAAEQIKLGDDLTLTVGGRVWVTSGNSDRTIGGGSSSTRLSELRWRAIDSVVPAVNADLVWKRLVVLVSLGGSVIKNGVLVDQDFDSSGAQIARTRSSIDDSDLIYFNNDVGARVWEWRSGTATSRGYVDVLLGFQYWREHYVGFGGTGFPVSSNPNVKSIENNYEWRSLRLGARTELPIYRGWSVKLRGYLVPWSSLLIEDTHFLRTDLRQNPSFRDRADGGIGGQIDGAVSYAIFNELSVELGFQYWTLTSASGDETAFTTTGNVRQNLNSATTTRYGPFVGARWRF